ncbi:oxygen-independent coproporphyrinogen III oxidase [Oceaniglobus ichthyenteri]|uniref:oxygen-independent coproporphyrinogen III oxidase n=1 Tax=Oceaniglobus ichthyenteri TaxID=2136177 RepID=UPI000D33DF9D|nr:oxygen-independent coproporphyrinogen III oxidase [Oceaniglobus ichthyenteri]
METIDLRALGLFDARVPRYTSYPPATVFSRDTGVAQQAEWLAQLNPDIPVSVYVHIPFCERLCWFCACRTQGTTSLAPVERYLATLLTELELLRPLLPKGLRMGRLHWGGGTPTILPPDMIRTLTRAVMDVFPPTKDLEFSVEIDPTLVDQAKIDMLAEQGMNRASIGIQDFDPSVQAAIGREQSFDTTQACVNMLRAAGVASLNADLVYGLPHQTPARFEATLNQVLGLRPDRVALFGYAHVPHMAKRQTLIPTDSLPGDVARYELACQAAERFVADGFDAIGIDHFARPSDTLARARHSGHLRRNFQGYTNDTCPTLIGLGASSISQFPQGFLQNAAATPAYTDRITAGQLAAHRGHTHTADDKLRARVIEMIMCDFRIDLPRLEREFGAVVETLAKDHDKLFETYGVVLTRDADSITIRPEGRPLTRLLARVYDAHDGVQAIYSQAS